MDQLVHTMPFLLTSEADLHMADLCLESLIVSDGAGPVVVYNQGAMSNREVDAYFRSKGLESVIIGDGNNDGIPVARQSCFQVVWNKFADIQFVSEIHLDMVFPPSWAVNLTEFLWNHPEEPIISPGILTGSGELHPEARGQKAVQIPQTYTELIQLLERFTQDALAVGFVHPVVHRSDVLRTIGGYDLRFLRGKQGYEDDSLLLGYRYYVGRGSGWRPKAYLKSRVYHVTLVQRMSMDNVANEFRLNLQGLVKQYGAYGLLELADIHRNPEFSRLERMMMGEFDEE